MDVESIPALFFNETRQIFQKNIVFIARHALMSSE